MARNPRSDPFTPGFGNLPRIFAGRSVELDDLNRMVERLADGVYEQPRMLTGDRGMGKTSLLLQFEQEQQEAGRWVVRAAATRDGAVIARLCRGLGRVVRDHDLAGHLADTVKAGLARLANISVGARGVSVGVTDGPVSASPGDDLRELLEAAGRLAREHGTVLALLIDEAQNIDLDTLGQLFYAIQEVQGVTVVERDPATGAMRRDSLPLAVVVAGLPGLVKRLKRAGSTFGERSKPHRLRALDASDVVVALREFAREGGAAFDADAADLVAEACGGYPYFLHVIGSHVWRAGTGPVITADDARSGVAQATPYLTAFYEQRLTEIGDLQRAYLHAAATIPASRRTSGAVAKALDRTSEQLGSTVKALVDHHGLLRDDGAGRLAFALPGLDRHLTRHSD
jgi:hypothetical protein